jgi:transcriptional regulator with XRE-family HTH domain
MPHITETAKTFDLTRAEWFGNAVSRRRKALNLTASELSRRTADLGYPVSRVAIAKIESNLRAGKIDVAEVLVLAAALDIPPALLIFPQLSTDGGSPVLPGRVTRDDDAVRWMSGQVSFPQEYNLLSTRLEGDPHPPNEGVNLIAAASLLEQALDTRISLVCHLQKVQGDAAEVATAERMLEKNSEHIEALRKQIRDAREALWGMRRQLEEVENGDGDD